MLLLCLLPSCFDGTPKLVIVTIADATFVVRRRRHSSLLDQTGGRSFFPFYVCTAVRKFFFFLDPSRTGRVKIKDLITSPILAELFVRSCSYHLYLDRQS